MRNAFTLMEIMIVISLVGALAVVALFTLNPLKQIQRGQDARRQSDLDGIRKALEDYYNDKGCYPTPDKICYDTADSNNTCHICGNEPTSPSFSPYLEKLPCDPQHPTRKYLYQAATGSCPSWYRTYADFSTTDNSASLNLGCGGGGCGPSPNYGYDYGVASPNQELQKTPVFFCFAGGCNNCGSYEQCLADPGCTNKSKIYGTNDICCNANPGWCR